VNVTKKGGFQLGLINVRDTADGVSLGLINIVKQGGIMEAGIEGGEFVHTAVTFRSGVQRLYSIISVGYNYASDENGFWMIGSGLGTSIPLAKNAGLNLELTQATLPVRGSQWHSFTQFKPVFNYRFAKHFKIYAGPSLNVLVLDRDNSGWFLGGQPLDVKIPYKMYHRTFEKGTFDMWVGVTGGIKF
jgi:hypothetical protein